ncbi:probable G-protein coupled receptor Mth-like 7 [Drosophila takahashii]|uniref:probable G-protein coupled receptor Mth-like 7 n=1 Tax=Drosophila takahashii TaxID=29030 RepID=UPI003899582C
MIFAVTFIFVLAVRTISATCNILTLFVYLYVRKLRNVLGKCIISTIFCLLIRNLISMDIFNLLNRICLLAGYSQYFIGIANNLWFSVISFHLWKLLTNRSEHSSFLKYSAFAWSMAAISTGVIYLANLIWEEDLHKWNWLPLVGYSGCSLEVWRSSYWIFFQGPVLTLTLFDIIMFILTVIHIWKVKSELRKFKRDEERTIQCFNFDSETYLMFLRLSFVMGAFWILDFLTLLKPNSIYDQIVNFSFYIESGFGTIIFILLILKRSTLQLLMERIRGGRQKQRPIAPRTTNNRRK